MISRKDFAKLVAPPVVVLTLAGIWRAVEGPRVPPLVRTEPPKAEQAPENSTPPPESVAEPETPKRAKPTPRADVLPAQDWSDRRWVIEYEDGAVVPVADSKRAFERFMEFAVARDNNGIAQMISSGAVAVAESGTEVKVINYGVFNSEVRILEGRLRGILVWVSTDRLKDYRKKRFAPAAEKPEPETPSPEPEQRKEPPAPTEAEKAAAVAREAGRRKKEEERRKVEEAKRLAAADTKATPYLRYAKKLLADGDAEKARQRLREIVRDFPGTKAAAEAKGILEKPGG